MKWSTIALCVCIALGLLSLGLMVSGQTYDYQASIVALRTEDGTAATQFKSGQFVFVDVQLTNIMTYTSATQAYLVVVRATYSQTLYGLAAFSGSMTPGQQLEVIPAFEVPSNAPVGTYDIQVMVFTTWPSNGGYPIAASVTTTFAVVP